MKYLITLSFLGGAYCGWQVQKNARSVQETFQDAVEKTFGARYPVTGCSRTDSGVHAEGFRCTVETDTALPPIPPASLPQALNARLPEDIAVIAAVTVPDGFHPRYAAKRKIYRYDIWNAPYRSPKYAGRAWHCPRPLNIERMREAGLQLIGEHDFAAFCASGSQVTDTVRTLYRLEPHTDGGHLISVTAEGDGFLYNMVRILCGTLVDVSFGKIEVGQIPDILLSRERANAGTTLPAHGLWLYRVIYDEESEQESEKGDTAHGTEHK